MCVYPGVKTLLITMFQIRVTCSVSIADLIAHFALFKKDVLIAKHLMVQLIPLLKNI